MAAILLSVFAARAMAAADRFAEPGGNGANPCDFSDPCSIETAVSGAASGDNVVPLGGTYNVSTTLQLPPDVDLQSGTGAVINSTASPAITVVASSPNTVVRGITLNQNNASGTGLELLSGQALQDVINSNGNNACVITGGITTALMTESVCNNSSGTGVAINSFSAVDSSAEIFDVTAVSGNLALFVSATAPDADVTLTGGNVIAQGTSADQSGFNSNNTSTTSHIELSNSNFDSFQFAGPGTSGTAADVNNNQSELPLLDGTFHELPGSPTINAGTVFPQSAFVDIDGDDRPQGAAMDIGADEAEGEAPDTNIDGKPPKRTSKRTAKFQFSSTDPGEVTFDCKIDGKPFKPCESGIKYQNLKRGKRHKFQVRSTDGFFNTDETPAKYGWRITG
jgi:hypothetical protein